MKKEYRAPVVVLFGTVKSLTHGKAAGTTVECCPACVTYC